MSDLKNEVKEEVKEVNVTAEKIVKFGEMVLNCFSDTRDLKIIPRHNYSSKDKKEFTALVIYNPYSLRFRVTVYKNKDNVLKGIVEYKDLSYSNDVEGVDIPDISNYINESLYYIFNHCNNFYSENKKAKQKAAINRLHNEVFGRPITKVKKSNKIN